MNKPSNSPSSRLNRIDRLFAPFLVLAVILLFFGNQFLSADQYKLAFRAVALIFLIFWLCGAIHMPAVIKEQFCKSHHPDEDVRALQDREISISQYAERKEAKQHGNVSAEDVNGSKDEYKRSNLKA